MNEQEAIRRTMALCSRKEYSAGEILDKLTEWEVPADKAQKVLELLIKEKFVDDMRFATAFVNDKLKFSKWGKIKINYMLRQKGISETIIDQTLSSIDLEYYIEILLSELKKKIKTVHANNHYELKGKLIQFAFGRGFEYDIASKAAETVIKSNFQ
jgi:regulatory protein